MFESRHIKRGFSRNVEQNLEAANIPSLAEERAAHAKIVVRPDRMTLIPRRPGSVERGQCRRWPVAVGIWRERRGWLTEPEIDIDLL